VTHYVKIVKGGWTPDQMAGVWVVAKRGFRELHLRRPGQAGGVTCRTDHLVEASVLDLLDSGQLEEDDDFRQSIYFCSLCQYSSFNEEPCRHFDYCERCDSRIERDELCECYDE